MTEAELDDLILQEDNSDELLERIRFAAFDEIACEPSENAMRVSVGL